MNLNFDKLNGLVPAVVQDSKTSKVLMVGFMNQKAIDKTLDSGKVTFFSRSKNRLWTKGEESGNFLELVEVIPDCDNDTLLITANPVGPVCHTGSDTCFNQKNEHKFEFKNLEKIIDHRKNNPVEGSYTTLLFEKGINKIAQKVGEEAVELVIESKDDNEELFLNEAADLMYHYIVLLKSKGYSLEDVEKSAGKPSQVIKHFQTERLYVRDLSPEDIAEFHDMQGDSEVMKYTTGHPLSYEENVSDLDNVISCYAQENNEFWVWAICLKDNDKFVGTCAVVSSEFDSNKEYEIGFRFLRKYWGKGFATEIINPLLNHGFKVINTKELIAYVDIRNISSIKVLKKGNPFEETEVLNPETNLPDLRFLYSRA